MSEINRQHMLSPIKSGIREYINTIMAFYGDFIEEVKKDSSKVGSSLLENIIELETIYRDVANINSLEELSIIKEEVLSTETLLDLEYTKSKISSLSGRERALVERGYDIHDVIRLSKYTEEEAQKAANAIFERLTQGCTRISHPTCTFLGGQPGCGKSTASMRIKSNNPENGVVEIGIDNYRSYHPHYDEMENVIRRYWQDKTPTSSLSPGNDIADFTHGFAGRVTDIITDKACELVDGKAYNIVMEWGMRTPDEPLKRMEQFKNNGYTNIVSFIAVHKDISWDACVLRADVMNNKQKHIIRRVPDTFHSLCIETLPDSCSKIYSKGYLENSFIDMFTVITRDGKILFQQNNDSNLLPGNIYAEVLNNPVYSQNLSNDDEIANLTFYTEAMGFKDKDLEHGTFGK